MTTPAKKPSVRVFLMSDYFTRRKDYYLVAKDEDDAIQKANHTTPTSYIEESGESFESTEVQEEVAVLTLRKIAPHSGQPQQVYLLPAYEAESADAYRGYEILEDGKISPAESTYPKSEWRLEK
jgi:hypothetical protein